MKNYTDLVKSINENVDSEAVELRESYLKGDIFGIGETVQLVKDGSLAEIINRGSNYVTVVQEGKTFKRWLHDILPTTESITKRNQIYKEDFIIKGYKTKNFTKAISEQFSDLAKSTKDNFAIYNFVVCVDRLLGLNESTLVENFNKFKVDYDRVVRYSRKFNMQIQEMEDIGDSLLEYALSENLKFSHQDKQKIANIISITVGYKSSGDPVQVVNESASIAKHSKYDSKGWQVLGSLFNKASEAGIEWNKDIFSHSTQRFMELR